MNEYVVDQFNPAGTGGNSYASGQITNVWGNWFGNAFQSLAWDPTSDAGNNPASGSLKITADFDGQGPIPDQLEIFDGVNGITPPLNGSLYTNFQCDVRFAAGSATSTNGSTVNFGHLQFGIVTADDGQDYFGAVDVEAGNTNWVHVSIPISVAADTNLLQINDVLLHVYGPYYGAGLSGTSTLWVDNLEFTGPPLAASGSCRVDGNAVAQRIDGFGASSAWQSVWTPDEANMFFSTNYSGTASSLDRATNFSCVGIGLSLLRSRIAPGGASVETNIMVMAQARGARVWSTPWSPAANFKSNGNVDGGSIVGTAATYQALAAQVAGYVANLKQTWGINLYAVSVQNEPDAIVDSYESCNWTAQQIHDYVPYLRNALVASNVSATKIMLPESQNWQDYSNLVATAMSDSTSNDVAIVADHNYDGPYGPASLVKNSHGKALWETEVCLLSGSDSSITNAIYYAGRIHAFLTQAQVNAWHYWWLMPYANGNEGLTDTNGVPAKRMYALGQFARFVRPNFYRIGVTNGTGPALLSAYKDPSSPNFAIVAINPNPNIVTQAFTLANLPAVAKVTPWLTTADLSLAEQAPVALNGSNFSYALPAMSIATFVAQPAAETAPVFVPIANQTINPGIWLVVTNVATNSNSPRQVPLYTLLAAPSNATLNATSGVVNWRPLVSQANTTNTISIQATDNGAPALSATNTFTVTVNPLAAPAQTVRWSAAGQLDIIVNGTQGPDYSLLVSSNLTRWLTLLTTNSPLLPLTFADTNDGAVPTRFYRVQVGP